MNKRDWGFLGFWVAVAGIAVTGGLGLPYFGYPGSGRWLFYTGLALAALLVFGEVARWAAGGVKTVSNPLLKRAQSVVRFLVEAVAWFGALLVGPVIRRALARADYPEATPHTWAACKKRGTQGSDFLAITREGHRLAGARFIVRPDRTLPHWHAGFRLTRRNEIIEKADLASTLLVEFSYDYLGDNQEGHVCARDGQRWGPFGLPIVNVQPPSRTIDVSVASYPTKPSLLQVTYQIDGQAPQWLEFSKEYAEQLVLVAWADSMDFLVSFEQISVSWSPVES